MHVEMHVEYLPVSLNSGIKLKTEEWGPVLQPETQ